MLIAAVADIHAGNHAIMGGPAVNGLNERCRKVVAVLAAAAKFAKSKGARLVIEGDVFDTARPSPQLVRAVMDALAVVETDVIPGNHDRVTDAPGDHALAPLGRMSNVRVYDEPALVGPGVNEFFCPPAPRGTNAAEWFAEVLPVNPFGRGLIHGHFGIVHAGADIHRINIGCLPQDVVFTLMRERGYVRGFFGDWHERKVFKRGDLVIEQVGALVPTGWDNPGPDFGYLTLYDTEAGTSTVHKFGGPRFYNVASVEEAAELKAKGAYVKLSAPRGTVAPEGVMMIEEVIKNERTPDEVRAQTAGSLDEALVQATTELVQPHLRDAVLARSRAALSAAGSS